MPVVTTSPQESCDASIPLWIVAIMRSYVGGCDSDARRAEMRPGGFKQMLRVGCPLLMR
jgi:hypothetical protein